MAQASAYITLQPAAFAAGGGGRRLRRAAAVARRLRRAAAAARRLDVAAQASSSNSSVSSVPNKDKPDWAGDDALSRFVNAAINFRPLYNLMNVGGRQMMKGTAEKAGVPCGATVDELSKSEVYNIKEEIEDKSLAYPPYYTVPFHGYDEGNLNWLAAFEVEPLSDILALRVWKTEELTSLQATTRLRKPVYTAIRSFQQQHGCREVCDAIDVGCSVGVSSRWLASEWPAAHVTGLDLSPYFLAVAELRERQLGGGAGQRQRIRYLHGNMEATGLPDASFDLVAVQFVTHECPSAVIESLVRECRRLLRPGGCLAIADNNPRSKVLQNLPPVLFTIMKSTEPHSDEYFQHDIEADMRAQGLLGVCTVESDPRHRVVLGKVPDA